MRMRVRASGSSAEATVRVPVASSSEATAVFRFRCRKAESCSLHAPEVASDVMRYAAVAAVTPCRDAIVHVAAPRMARDARGAMMLSAYEKRHTSEPIAMRVPGD